MNLNLPQKKICSESTGNSVWVPDIFFQSPIEITTFFRFSLTKNLVISAFRLSRILPFLPAHSISKLRIRKGATRDHSPSGGWEISLSQATSTSSWHRDTMGRLELGFRMVQVPGGSSIQLQPTICVSTINLKMKDNHCKRWVRSRKEL